MKIKRFKKIILLLLILIISTGAVLLLFPKNEKAFPQYRPAPPVIRPGYYDDYLTKHEETELSAVKYTLSAASFTLASGETLNDDIYHWQNDVALSFEVDIADAGWYLVYFNYRSQSTSHLPTELSLQLNGTVPYREAALILLDNLWQDDISSASFDRYGNDILLKQKPYRRWLTVPLADAGRMYASGLKFYLEAGINCFTVEKISGDICLKEIIVGSEPQLPLYREYINRDNVETEEGIYRIEAENTAYKNSSSIIRGTSRDVGVLPFSKTKLKLNVLGTDSYHMPGEAVTWVIDIVRAGYYCLTFKVKQEKQYTTSYRTLLINGQIPFREAAHLTFSYNRQWQNITLCDNNGQPYLFYLEPDDEISLAVPSDIFTNISIKIKELAAAMTELGLDVTKLTHNNVDKGIDWNMLEYFPDLPDVLAQWVLELADLKESLGKIYGFKSKAQIIQDITVVIAKLNKIARDINELPRRLSLLSQGPASAAQLLANHIDAVREQPLLLDAVYIHNETSALPKANGGFFRKIFVGISRFFSSFFDKSYRVSADKDELEVWVNRSRPYVDIIQKIVDDDFTGKTGIKVKVSLMNNDSKLILANSANRGPDVALGVSAWIPHEYGMRGMLADIARYPDFKEAIVNYNPEQLVPMIYDEGLYGLPETENFYVLLYRKDIMEKLNLSIPETWDDVIAMLPVLNRYGMSFYLPLSNMSSMKAFDTTAPFIFQHQGKLYSDDAFAAAIDDEATIAALTLMTDFYRQYGIPHQIPSFFNSFRQQTIPIGIADFGTYLQLINAAAEIRGLWDIALVPGVRGEDGEINRAMPGAQQAGIIFKNSKHPEEAWRFLKWWLTTETQTLFADTMLYTLGSKYVWNSANLHAFSELNWSEAHKAVILEQWTHLKEVPKIPGSYMLERELSNIWNKVVYDDVNIRSAAGDALIVINKEINRKMTEFGYADESGNKIRQYRLPSADTVRRWLSDD